MKNIKAFGLMGLLVLVFNGTVLAADAPLVGKWGYTLLGKGQSGIWFGWKTEAGTLTFNSNGTGMNQYAESADTCPDEYYCKPSDGGSFTYTVNQNQDGTYALILNFDGGKTHNLKIALSDNNTVFIADGTALDTNAEMMFVGVKMDASRTYTNADVTGQYYTGAYEYDALGNPYPQGLGKYRLWSITSDANNGNFLLNGMLNSDGSILQITGQTKPYNVTSEGTMYIGDQTAYSTGYVGDGKVAIFSNPGYGGIATDFSSFIALKKDRNNYAQTDLQGTWIVSTFGDYTGTVFRSEFGMITCNAAGNCTASLSQKSSDGITVKTNHTLPLMTVSDNGSLNGFSMTNSTPHFAGAIGNDGKTMLLVMLPSAETSNDRGLGIAVKCSNCSNPSTITLSAGWNFISFPQLPASPAPIETVLRDVSPSVKIVWGYDNQSKAWLKYSLKTQHSTLNTLDIVETGLGYWIYMADEGVITYAGQPASLQAIKLYNGWNLTGYSGTSSAVAAALNSIANKWIIIWNWNNGEWFAHRADGQSLPVSDLTTVEQKKAYWIKTNLNAGQTANWQQQ